MSLALRPALGVHAGRERGGRVRLDFVAALRFGLFNGANRPRLPRIFSRRARAAGEQRHHKKNSHWSSLVKVNRSHGHPSRGGPFFKQRGVYGDGHK